MSLWTDAKNIAQKDPAAKSVWEVILLYAGWHALLWHRLAHFFFRHRLFFLARALSQINRFFYRGGDPSRRHHRTEPVHRSRHGHRHR